MGEETKIAWTDSSWSPWWGCTRVSPACGQGGQGGCYAEAFSKRVGHGKRLPLIWGPRAERRFFPDKHWSEPLKWNRKAARSGVRRRLFCASMADVFERVDGETGEHMDAARERLWGLIEQTPWIDWQVLTKRPENFGSMLPARWQGKMPLNLWLGVTVESVAYVPRVQHLLRTCAAITFISAEPLLEDISEAIVPYIGARPLETNDGRWLSGDETVVWELGGTRWPSLDQIIVGGESGPRSRAFDVEWARRLGRACHLHSTAFFCKQLGSNPCDGAKRCGGMALPARFKSRAAEDPNEWPIDLRVREFPRGRGALRA